MTKSLLKKQQAVLALLASLAFLSERASGAEKAGEWILAAPKASLPILEPLMERRKKDGFHVIVLDSAENGERLREEIKAEFETAPAGANKYVLLAGSPPLVGSLLGSVRRMAGHETDTGFGLPDADGAPTVAVGRFPARTEAELRGMVEKTLRFEDDRPPAGWRSGVFLMVGNPGGGALANLYVQGTVDADLAQLDPAWNLRALFNIPGSRFFCPPPFGRSAASNMFEQGALFSLYLGHSNAGGMDFLGRRAFAAMSIPHGNGPFFTCGCYALEREEEDGEDGYGLKAMRNPLGPVAVIGATGESYSAPGQWAAQGLMTCLATSQPPERLGDYWLATAAGLARGKMDGATYALLDAADGSSGEETMETARREHLEMWMLLGDPALRLPLVSREISLDTFGTPRAGRELAVSGLLPSRLEGANVVITAARPISSLPTGLENVPMMTSDNAEEVARKISANNERANEYVIAGASFKAQGNRFSTTLLLPTNAPWPQIVLRASAFTSNDCARGVKVLTVKQQ